MSNDIRFATMTVSTDPRAWRRFIAMKEMLLAASDMNRTFGHLGAVLNSSRIQLERLRDAIDKC